MTGGSHRAGAPDIDEDDLAAFFGPNADFYINEKRVIEGSGSRVSWNWPAFLFSFLWMFHRKMWAEATLVAVLSVILNASIFFSWATLIVMLIVGMYGNAIYVSHAKKKVFEIGLAAETAETRREVLAKAGGTAWGPVVFVFLVVVSIIILLIMLWGGMLTALLGGFIWWDLMSFFDAE